VGLDTPFPPFLHPCLFTSLSFALFKFFSLFFVICFTCFLSVFAGLSSLGRDSFPPLTFFVSDEAIFVLKGDVKLQLTKIGRTSDPMKPMPLASKVYF